jgi:hypothetical protein
LPAAARDDDQRKDRRGCRAPPEAAVPAPAVALANGLLDKVPDRGRILGVDLGSHQRSQFIRQPDRPSSPPSLAHVLRTIVNDP